MSLKCSVGNGMISPFPRHQNKKNIKNTKKFFIRKWHKKEVELCVHKVCPCFFFLQHGIINVLEHRIFHMKYISFHSDGRCICVYLFAFGWRSMTPRDWLTIHAGLGSSASVLFFITSHDFGVFPPFSRPDGDGNFICLSNQSWRADDTRPHVFVNDKPCGENLCRQKKQILTIRNRKFIRRIE